MCFLIHHFLENSADRFSDKEAIVHRGQRYSYSEIDNKANQVANWLLQSGVGKGDRVCIWLKNSVEYVICYYGILKAGAIAVPINTGVDVRELKSIIFDCAPRMIISQTQFFNKLQHLGEISSKLLIAVVDQRNKPTEGHLSGLEWVNFYLSIEAYDSQRPEQVLIDCDVSSIIYTSGSTGKPKGVMLTHGNIVANTKSIASYLRLSSSERCMVVLPFYYVFGKSLLNTHFHVSGTVILFDQMIFPNMILKTMIDENITGFAGVPSTYAILLYKSTKEKYSLPALRYLAQAGGHLPKSIKRDLIRRFPNKEIFIMYGATEASARIAYLEPHKLLEKINSIGKPIPNVEMKIVSKNEGELAPNQVGEIAARGSNIMMGYWKDDIETSKVIRDGWYHTGDLGYRDDDGYYHITGRKRDMIKAGNFKVCANEIEEIIYQHEAVYEAAVKGYTNNELTEEIHAYIALKKGSDVKEKEILEFCETRISHYKIPNKIFFTDSLPKNDHGKILKNNLHPLDCQSN
jgi:acyl-CoA synthetase (AMP-forming)/AMP-acid ligase II